MTVVQCVKEHVNKKFDDVNPIPKGSRWESDDPVVKANPSNFKPTGGKDDAE